jgi:hypothetical protein
MSDPDGRLVEYERLNVLGKALFLGGTAVRLAADAIDATVRRAADIYVDAEKAFQEGRDPNIEDAKILDEDA